METGGNVREWMLFWILTMFQILYYIVKHAISFKLSTVDCYSYFLKQGNWDSSKSNSHYIVKKKKNPKSPYFYPQKAWRLPLASHWWIAQVQGSPDIESQRWGLQEAGVVCSRGHGQGSSWFMHYHWGWTCTPGIYYLSNDGYFLTLESTRTLNLTQRTWSQPMHLFCEIFQD